MAHGLGNTPENQTDPHTCGKQHTEPSEIGVLRFFMLHAKFEITILAKSQIEIKHQKEEISYEVSPAEMVQDLLMQKSGKRKKLIRPQHARYRKNKDQEKRNDKYDVIFKMVSHDLCNKLAEISGSGYYQNRATHPVRKDFGSRTKDFIHGLPFLIATNNNKTGILLSGTACNF